MILSGLSGWLPPRTVGNSDVLAHLPEGLSEEWIVQRTGIRERRRVDPDMSTSDMAVRAAAPLVASTPGRIDAVVVATTTPDFPIPATAPIVAAELGLVEAAAWDVNSACSGFITGLAAVTSMIAAGVFGRALLIGADAMSTVVDRSDRNTAILFGDGAGAVLLEADSGAESGSFGPFDLGSDGGNTKLVGIDAGGSRQRSRTGSCAADHDHYLHMAGPELFTHAVRRMTASSATAIKDAGWEPSDVDWLVAHQANARILSAVADRLGIPEERCVVNVDLVGNTSAASIPLAMAHLHRSGRVRAGDRVLLTAFGAGLAWGSTTLAWPDLPH
ncbi:beta-ketoacyl-ACP synthase III [Streptomyces sp. NPDC090045]|uniref:beta-ketoacyl-ACP synthase III n=1 Tax=Streptomyces sp. NPDC090045 TaxID=3365927 RepID=UPI0037FA6F47